LLFISCETSDAAIANLRMPSVLALTDVSVVSLRAMRLTMGWSVALD